MINRNLSEPNTSFPPGFPRQSHSQPELKQTGASWPVSLLAPQGPPISMMDSDQVSPLVRCLHAQICWNAQLWI